MPSRSFPFSPRKSGQGLLTLYISVVGLIGLIRPFSLHVVERREVSHSRSITSRWHQATCYGTTDEVASRQPSERQRAIFAIFQAPSSTFTSNLNVPSYPSPY